MLTRGVLMVGLLALPAGCAEQGANERYVAFCANHGLVPGSDPFAHCIEQQRAKDLIEAQRIRSMRGLRPER